MVEVNIPERAPKAAPSVVLTATRDAVSPNAAELILMVEPGLNPYQPNRSANVPRNYVEVNEIVLLSTQERQEYKRQFILL